MLAAIWTRVRAARVALLAAGLSYYLLASLLPLLVLASGLLGFFSRRDGEVAPRVVAWLGVEGQAADLVQESIEHAEQTHVTSSAVGIVGLVWAALAVTGALRRAVDAVWGEPDIGWTARLRTMPWMLGAGVLLAASLVATSAVRSVGPLGGVLAALAGAGCTVALSAWFLGRLGTNTPSGQALAVSAVVLTVGFEIIKNGAVLVAPRLVSRDSALYGGIGSALAALVGILATSWLLLIATAIAAELSSSDRQQGGIPDPPDSPT